MGRKASRGRICLITGIYSVFSPLSRDLSSLLKKSSQALAKEKKCHGLWRQTRGGRSLPLCLSLPVLATPSYGTVMPILSLCPAYACKSPSRGHRDGYWEPRVTMTMTYLCDSSDEGSYSISPRLQQCLKGGSHMRNSTQLLSLYSHVCTWGGGGGREKHLCPSFAYVHSSATSCDLSLYRVGPGDMLI